MPPDLPSDKLCLTVLQGFAQQVTFGIVTDIHFAEIPRSGTRKYTQLRDKLKEYTDVMNRNNRELLVEPVDFRDKSKPFNQQKTRGFSKQEEKEFRSFRKAKSLTLRSGIKH